MNTKVNGIAVTLGAVCRARSAENLFLADFNLHGRNGGGLPV